MTPALARHAPSLAAAARVAAITALATDAHYTWRHWLIDGRPHPAWKYALIVGQLSVETAIILHLWSTLKQAEDQQTQPGKLKAVA